MTRKTLAAAQTVGVGCVVMAATVLAGPVNANPVEVVSVGAGASALSVQGWDGAAARDPELRAAKRAWISVKVWQAASGATKARVTSNASSIRVQFVGDSSRTAKRVNSGAKLTAPQWATTVRAKSVKTRKLASSGWRSVAVFAGSMSAAPSAYEAEVLRLTNAARAKSRVCGNKAMPAVRAVRWNGTLGNAARLHSADMAKRNFFSHTNPDGKSPADRVKKQGYQYSYVGENIAAGFQTPADVVQGWIDSPGHCLNLMNSGFTELGVGYHYQLDTPYRSYWTQNFGRPAN